MRVFLFIILLIISLPVFPAHIVCYQKGKKILEQESNRIFVDSENEFISVENMKRSELNNANCTIKYKFSKKGRD